MDLLLERVEHDDVVAAGHEACDEPRSDETGTAGDECAHLVSSPSEFGRETDRLGAAAVSHSVVAGLRSIKPRHASVSTAPPPKPVGEEIVTVATSSAPRRRARPHS
jgi:hypothetical protein